MIFQVPRTLLRLTQDGLPSAVRYLASRKSEVSTSVPDLFLSLSWPKAITKMGVGGVGRLVRHHLLDYL